MKYNRVISTAVLFLLLGTTLPAFAQKGEEEKGGGKSKTARQNTATACEKAAQQRKQNRSTHRRHSHSAHRKRSRNVQRRHSHSVQRKRSHNAPKCSSPQGSERRPLLATVAAGNMAAFLMPITTSHFGHDHSFHMGHPEMRGGYNRFQYGGYSFGYNQGWPVGWGYNDNFYVEYIDGAYFLCDLRFPGVQLTLNMF